MLTTLLLKPSQAKSGCDVWFANLQRGG